MPHNDIDNGRSVCVVGMAALRSAEFVIFRVGQQGRGGGGVGAERASGVLGLTPRHGAVVTSKTPRQD